MLSAGVPRPSGTWRPQAGSADPPGMPAAGLPRPPGGARQLSPGPPAPDPAAAAAEAAAPAPASQAPAAASLLCARGPEAATCNHRCLCAAGQRPPAAPHLTHLGHRRPSPALRSWHPPGAQQALGRPAPARPRSLRLLHLLQFRCSPSLPLPGSVPATLLPAAACPPYPSVWALSGGRLSLTLGLGAASAASPVGSQGSLLASSGVGEMGQVCGCSQRCGVAWEIQRAVQPWEGTRPLSVS